MKGCPSSPAAVAARRYQVLGVLVLVVGMGLFHGVTWRGGLTGDGVPAFAAIADLEQRKAAFLEWLAPQVAEANATVRADRDRLEALRGRMAAGTLSRGEAVWLQRQAARHRTGAVGPLTPECLEQLSIRIDEIPPALVLAQAALESGWGTSRLAREDNNLFGITAPPRMASYRSPRQSVQAYFHLLNSHPAYADFRELRRQMRAEGRPLSGADLAAGLLRYSEEGPLYIAKVRHLIHTNALEPESLELALF